MVLSLLVAKLAITSVLIQGGTVIDGSGKKGRVEDVRIQGSTILQVGHLKPRRGETVVPAKGMVVCPGFIDAHSHADEGIVAHPTAESQIRQGITTSIVGQDGIWNKPVSEAMADVRAARPALNFAWFSGHGGIREKVLGKGQDHVPNADQLIAMKAFVERDMKAGALGLSTGLEYMPATLSKTPELVALSQVASKYGGMYISHMRDESNRVMNSIDELIRIGREAHLPVQISHVKMAVASTWGRSGEALAKVAAARRLGVRITMDVYPYTFWQSTIRVLTTSLDWHNRQVWVDALKDVGGPNHVKLTTYTPRRSWEGKTLADIAAAEHMEAPDLILRIITETEAPGQRESILCQAMQESDVRAFIADPHTMFCSDGSIGGSHPRGAGSFPRVLGVYVREQKVAPIEDVLRRMTSFPAQTFHLSRRGLLRPGYAADVLIFDPRTIRDRSTPERPTDFATGVQDVWVNGVWTLKRGLLSGLRGGRSLKRGIL